MRQSDVKVKNRQMLKSQSFPKQVKTSQKQSKQAPVLSRLPRLSRGPGCSPGSLRQEAKRPRAGVGAASSSRSVSKISASYSRCRNFDFSRLTLGAQLLKLWQFSGFGFQPLNHHKQKCKMCPNNNHVLVPRAKPKASAAMCELGMWEWGACRPHKRTRS